MSYRAGTLNFSNVEVGVTADEIVALALANLGLIWQGNSAGFAWGISNLAGLPFFNLRNETDGPANTVIDTGFDSPHWWDSNTRGDGWQTVSTSNSVSQLAHILKVGDIVRVYDWGNWSETSYPDHDGSPNALTFIVVSTTGGRIEVVDNSSFNCAVIRHDWTDIVHEMARGGCFQSAYVSRVIDKFVDDHVPETLQGNGFGDWSGIGGDLAITAAPIVAAITGSGGQSFTFSYRVDNPGSIAATASTTGVYLSTDSTITRADTLLTTNAVAALLAGGFYKGSGTFTVPTGVAAGTYYIGVIADYDNKVGETNENNNASPAVQISFGSDLDVRTAPSLKAAWVAAGGTFTLGYKVDNIGLTASAVSHAGIYLSTDSTITKDDRLIGVGDVESILAGGSASKSVTLAVPGDVKAGNYYIGVIADYDDTIVERNEANNPSPAIRVTVFTDGADKITVPVAEKAWHALGGNDTITGSSGRDAIYGDAGDDSLSGGSGNDTLIGGAGRDILTGGAGADYFQFDSVADIGKSAGSRDFIKDWDPKADYIDLRNIDANSTTSANDKFKFVAAAGSSLSGVKGQLRWVQQNHAGTADDRTLVIGDVNGDKVSDFIIEIKGLHTMHAIDFLL